MRFRPTWSTTGTETVGAWEVIELFTGSDGLKYARLANIADASKVKSLARDALLNRKLYRRLD
jgi:hypothetical protein